MSLGSNVKIENENGKIERAIIWQLAETVKEYKERIRRHQNHIAEQFDDYEQFDDDSNLDFSQQMM